MDGYGGACFGQVADLLSRLADYLGRPTAVPPGRAAFVRTGTVWRLEFRGRAVTVVDSKGMRDLAVLLARPGQEVHVLDLVEASGGPSRAAAGADTGPMIDAAARAAYKRRLLDLEDEIETAAPELRSRPTRHACKPSEEFLAAELAAALGLGGRPTAERRPGRESPEGGGDADRHRPEGDRGRTSRTCPASAQQRVDRTVLPLPARSGHQLAADGAT